MRRVLPAFCLLLAGIIPAAAQEPIRIGFLSTFSGPEGLLGEELLNGFKIGLASTDQKIGGRPVELVIGDDQARPDIGRQLADKMIESDHAQIITGTIFSNVILAIIKPVTDAGAFFIGTAGGPSLMAGKMCNPRAFFSSFQNDSFFEAAGLALNQMGAKRVFMLAPNYPAGHDMLNGFRKTFKGAVVAEDYTAFGQLDYAVEIARIREMAPDQVVFFYPGGMGINFVKQFAQSGLGATIKLTTGNGSMDQPTLNAMGEAGLGMNVATNWSEQLPGQASKDFTAAYTAAYHRHPSPFAAMAYDTVHVLDAAAQAIGGRIEDKAAFQRALEQVKFTSVRDNFAFNTNHMPIQDYILAEVARDPQGNFVAAYRSTITHAMQDSFVHECRMPAP